jgi:amino acid adenylation domain-containing protein
MTLLAAYAALLHRYTGQDDIVVGCPIANRTRSELEQLIGCFMNPLPLRIDLSGDPPFRELLGRVRETALGALAHQDTPFDLLVQTLLSRREFGALPLFQVMFLMQNISEEPPRLGGLSVTLENHGFADLEQVLYPVALEVSDSGAAFAGYVEYTDEYDATLSGLPAHFDTLLRGIVADPDQRIGELPVLPSEQRRALVVDWSGSERSSPGNECAHELFEEGAAASPNDPAVIFGEQELSYGELDRQANQLAHHLRGLGVGPEARVGVFLERSPEMIVGLLGILKAGGAYVPLDPTYPKSRLAFMLRDAGVQLLLAHEHLLAALPSHDTQVVCLDRDRDAIANESSNRPDAPVASSNLAYVIYTSGSTGTPKGVMVEHRALVNFVKAAGDTYALQPCDRVLQFASLSFDTAAEEIYPCLARGSTLVLRDDAMLQSVRRFLERCGEWKLTVLDLPTAYWHELVAGLAADRLELPPELRLVIIGGERAAPESLVRWKQHVGSGVRLMNTYGPTEATVVATWCDLSALDPETASVREVPIGFPIPNARVFVLDERLEPTPVGVPGDLYIGGVGLARGYLGRPDLTERSFVQDPFSGDPGERLYKTGDRACFLPDASLEFRGRLDRQVKLRGFRIEVDEIEDLLTRHRAVTRCVVILRDDDPVGKRLVAYFVADPQADPTPRELREHLRTELPEYMVPSAFVRLDALPLTPNRKIDYEALPAPDQTRSLEETYVAPRSELERKLALIWCQALGVERVGIDDNFFEIGGHSLLAIQVITKFEEATGFRLSPTDFFRQTLGQLAASFEEQVSDRPATAIAGTRVQTLEPMFFGRNDRQLFGCLRVARSSRNRGVVMCHPHAHEYIRCHRAQRVLAERLSTAGYHVLSFDYYGCGDSAGEYAEGRVRGWCTDIAAAIDAMKGQFGLDRVCLVGLRLGATMAMMVGADREDVDAIALWDPIVQGSDIAEELVRIREGQSLGSTGGDIPNDSFSYPLSSELEDDLRKIDLTAIRSLLVPHVLVLETEGGVPARGLARFLEGIGEDVHYQRVAASMAWLQEPFKAIVPQETLQALVAWISRVCP